MKRTSNILVFAALAGGALLAACNTGENHRKPGRIYMPDMYDSRAYEFYSPRLAGLKPVEGTVKRGELLPYHVKEGDTALANTIKNPLTNITEADLAEAKRIYNIYCGICHGTNLDGNGPLYKGGEGPFPAAPANLAAGGPKAHLTQGRLFYVMTYGWNTMGSYASQLDREQRWKIAAYIKSVQGEKIVPAPDAAPVTETASPAASDGDTTQVKE
ncbi:c-type cytochrome [Chitinophaga japonensis]|uniref:Cbb3-type cytochrome c oxidase subunit III n=1 Tax=Chitinophaga japonensis TaxID=104662 RepID=A0A562TD67_CHIJA|nr:cytochrome c [Chitinophaga japonensis]TWI91501.1 cbb3-type cytochrome c oxidase subunit III [Chitinophaga japonensis]